MAHDILALVNYCIEILKTTDHADNFFSCYTSYLKYYQDIFLYMILAV